MTRDDSLFTRVGAYMVALSVFIVLFAQLHFGLRLSMGELIDEMALRNGMRGLAVREEPVGGIDAGFVGRHGSLCTRIGQSGRYTRFIGRIGGRRVVSARFTTRPSVPRLHIRKWNETTHSSMSNSSSSDSLSSLSSRWPCA